MEMQYSAELIGAENIKKLIDKFPKLREKAKSVLASNSYFLQWKSQEKCPVDTGTLKRSIVWKWEQDNNEGLATFIGTNIPYAGEQEFNEQYHHNIGEWGYFRKSLAETAPKFKKDLEDVIMEFSR